MLTRLVVGVRVAAEVVRVSGELRVAIVVLVAPLVVRVQIRFDARSPTSAASSTPSSSTLS